MKNFFYLFNYISWNFKVSQIQSFGGTKKLLVFQRSLFRFLWIIKQFVETNCKERPGSIVIETLKNTILMPIDISKELAFYADSEYVSLIKFSLTHQKLLAWENFSDSRKKKERPLQAIEFQWKSRHRIRRIKEPYFRGFKLTSSKMWNFEFLPEERSRMRVSLFLCCFFSFSGEIVST